MATRIAIMSGGSVMQTGTPREVYDHPNGRFVANFVGETNFISGIVKTEAGRQVFTIPGRCWVAAPTGSTDGPATIMVRPEYVLVRPVDQSGAAPGIIGTIVNIAFLGDHTRITLTTEAGDIVAVRPHGTTVTATRLEEELGQEVCVWWPADDAALITD
jgi:spermidine/putrescine transport system ATP-binding protein